MRMVVAEVVEATLASLGLHYPSLSDEQRAELERLRHLLGG